MTTPPHESRIGRTRLEPALFVIVAFQLMVAVDGTVMNVALPAIERDLGFSVTDLSWVLNAYTVLFGGLLLLGGRAGDILGRRRVFVAGVLVFTLASLVGGLAPNGAWLLAARAVQGAGAALGAPSTLALIASTFAEGEPRNRALGVFSTVAGLGLAIGLILGGVLTQLASWRWVLFINVPVGVLIVAAARSFVVEPPRHRGRFDLPGAALSTVGMTLLVYGLVRGAGGTWRDAATIAPLIAGALLLLVFAAVEGRQEQPIMPLRLFTERVRAAAYLDMLLLVAAMFSMFFFVVQFLQNGLGFSPLLAGIAFLPMALVMFVASRRAPRLIPALGPKWLILLGGALIAAGLLWLATVAESSTYASTVLGPLILIGAGAGLSFMPLNMTIMTGLPPRDLGSASGTLQAMQQAGSSIGLAVLIAAFGMAGGSTVEDPGHTALIGALRTPCLIGASFALVAVIVTAVGIKPKPPSGGQTRGEH